MKSLGYYPNPLTSDHGEAQVYVDHLGKLIEAVIVEAGGYLGIGVANLITALHPDLVVLGGGVAKIGDLLFDTVRQTVKQRVGRFPPDDVRIEPSQLGDQAGTWGGLALATDPSIVSPR